MTPRLQRDANPKRIKKIDLTTTCDHVVFVSSSGHCSLDCPYCIVSPVVKHQPSLTYADLAFLLEQLKGRAFLIFSGKGDFFAGYHKKERLLERLLAHDIEIALDINGVILHELPELEASAIAKFRFVNLTLHYHELKRKGALAVWARNALTLVDRLGESVMFLGFILTPAERPLWGEALDFYRRAVHAETGMPLVLIKDVQRPFTDELRRQSEALAEANADIVAELFEEDLGQRFASHDHVLCPAGTSYFRLWNDGRIEGCPYIEARRDCGNVKERRFLPLDGLFRCNEARHCDCNNIALTGKMVFPSL
ncbi:MAG: hypothetical protein ACK4TK_09840 [Thiobacillaceae bacterium]